MTFTLTDENYDSFLEALWGGKEVFSVDLMAANPDIRAQVSAGGYTVSVAEVKHEDATYFVAFADDGFDGHEPETFAEFVSICATEPEARAAADTFIMDWKRAWDLA